MAVPRRYLCCPARLWRNPVDAPSSGGGGQMPVEVRVLSAAFLGGSSGQRSRGPWPLRRPGRVAECSRRRCARTRAGRPWWVDLAWSCCWPCERLRRSRPLRTPPPHPASPGGNAATGCRARAFWSPWTGRDRTGRRSVSRWPGTSPAGPSSGSARCSSTRAVPATPPSPSCEGAAESSWTATSRAASTSSAGRPGLRWRQHARALLQEPAEPNAVLGRAVGPLDRRRVGALPPQDRRFRATVRRAQRPVVAPHLQRRPGP
jgi:hypothetical protein